MVRYAQTGPSHWLLSQTEPESLYFANNREPRNKNRTIYTVYATTREGAKLSSRQERTDPLVAIPNPIWLQHES